MSLQDWLITAGVLVLVLVLADGLRRMRKRGKLRLEIDKQFEDLPEDDLSSELPNGGARPAGPSALGADEGEVDLLMDEGLKGVGEGADVILAPKKSTSHFKYQQQVSAPVAGAADTVKSTPASPSVAERIEPAFADDIDLLDGEPLAADDRERLMVSDCEGMDDGIIGPVRVRKQVKPETTAAEVEATTEPSPEAPTAPVMSEVVPEVTDNIDLSRPVTELMADRIPPAVTREPFVQSEVPEPAQPVADSEEPVVEALSSRPAELDAEPLKAEGPATEVVVEEAPLLAEKIETEEPLSKKDPKAKKPSRIQRWKEEIQTSFFDIDPELDPDPELAATTEQPAKKKKSQRKKSPARAERSVSQAVAEEEDELQVLAMTVTAKDEFTGPNLFKLVKACGMEFGEMDIFHRYEEGQGKGAIQFSMVNGVKPGHFKLEEQDSFSSPAVSFFLQMSEPTDLMNAFECMLATAQCVVENLDGVLKDENHSVMRTQTIEHYRQQIRDYERRRLARQHKVNA